MTSIKDDLYTFCLFGRSGAGKGVQSKMLLTYLENLNPDNNAIYVETGQLFRDFVKNNQANYSSGKVREVIVGKGGLLPAFLPVWMWANHLIKNFSGKEHLVLDGLARRVSEAPILEEALLFYGRFKPFIVDIEISDEFVMNRLLKRDRVDDTEEKIRERLEWYDKNVVPSINYFRNSDKVNFIVVNGEQTPEEVHTDIIKNTIEKMQ